MHVDTSCVQGALAHRSDRSTLLDAGTSAEGVAGLKFFSSDCGTSIIYASMRYICQHANGSTVQKWSRE